MVTTEEEMMGKGGGGCFQSRGTRPGSEKTRRAYCAFQVGRRLEDDKRGSQFRQKQLRLQAPQGQEA